MNATPKPIFPEYLTEKTLKISNRGIVLVVRHKDSQKRFVYREFHGNAEVYRKLQKVNSPHLPAIYEVAEQDNRVFVLEEYISGDTLAFLLEENPLNFHFAKEIALQICDALHILHELNMVHRDVKPGNIIIRGNNAVLIDFDTSRVVKSENFSDTRIMGTTGYAAPEQYGFSQTDARADIYSMGILLNEMLTNQHPSKLLTDGPLRSVIEKCIEVNVDKRYLNAAELKTAIHNCIPPRKHWSILMGVIAAVLALCAAAVVLTGGTPAEQEWNQKEISSEIWPGEIQVYQAAFLYDLDGDGEHEEYLFGIFHEEIPREFAWTMSDQFWLGGEASVQRNVAPAVWKHHEDDSWELMEEFAPLLEDAQIRVWRGSEQNGAAPRILEHESIWQGGICLVFEPDCLGTWLYELNATIDGHELTALCKSTMIEG